MSEGPLLQVAGLTKFFRQGRRWERRFLTKALDGVDLNVEQGTTLALVGESGSGKSTLALCAAMLEKPDAGDIRFAGRDLLRVSKAERAELRPQIQIVFQDSAAALPPHFSAAQIVEEPLLIQRRGSAKERSTVVREMMARVGLSPEWAHRFPSQFSGGERQRLAIARALVLRPRLLILDEPFVGLDLSIRGQIGNLLLALQAEFALTYLYISHDLDVVQYFADSVAVMSQGRIVEQGSAMALLRSPRHAETQALLARSCSGFAPDPSASQP